MIDFYPSLPFYLVQNLLRPKIRWNEPSRYWGIPLPLLHSESFTFLGMPGFLVFDYFGAFAHAARAGIIRVLLRNRWTWVAGKQAMFMKRPVRLLRPLVFEDSIPCWTDRFLVRRTEYFQKGELCAVSYTAFYILTRGDWKKVPTAELQKKAGEFKGPSQSFPPEIAHWSQGDLTR